jgi:DNA-binding winged helix-turn-helix (wHTH) protein/predicted ATPase
MDADARLHFPPFQLDPANQRLWRKTHVLRLRQKTFAVLHYLVEHPNQLVTKEQLLAAVWPEVYVSEVALSVCIREVRRALGDDRKAPLFIETVHGRGYRFIAPVTLTPPAVQGSLFKVPPSLSAARVPPSTIGVVGRDAELAQLYQWWARALAGERHIVFVSGEAGIGKTTVVEAFLDHIAAEGSLWIGRGQCVEHYGAGEGYMPVLEALGRLCRESEGARVIAFLHQHAPTWLAQMPALLGAAERERLQREVAGATRERMLREMAEALEALTAHRPLVLRLEDLHWSDHSTLELLSVLARRREAARLLVLGTYRPVEMLANGHPLRTVRQELQLHKQCEEQRLTFLSEDHVAEYLTRRFAGGIHGQRKSRADAVFLQALARTVHQRTEGNPLFMVNVADYLAAQGGLGAAVESVQVGIPGDLRQLIEEQIHRLSATERQVLEVASVEGAEFSAAVVAAGLGTVVEEVEERCEGLVRREQFLRTCEPAEWPDGTMAARYQFLHTLYQEVLYEHIPAARRSRLHRLLGERTEAAYGAQVHEVAAELALHFERGRDYRRAIQYLQHAGENAVRRAAPQEATTLLTKGLELLKTLPETPERTQQELLLQITLGPVLMATRGYAAPEVGHAYTRARELCRQVGETPQLFPTLWGLWAFYLVGAEHARAHDLGEQLLAVAQGVQDPALLLQAHYTLGLPLFNFGKFVPAREHFEQSLALYDPGCHRLQAFLYGSNDPQGAALSFVALILWILGYPDQALSRSREAHALAQELSYPFNLATTQLWATWLHQFRREGHEAQARAEATIALSTDQGFSQWVAIATIFRGTALAEQGQEEEGIAQMRQGLSVLRASGTAASQPYYLALLAEAYGKMEQAEEGLVAVAEALEVVHKTGEHFYEAELYRLRGELTWQKSQVSRSKFQVEKPHSAVPTPQVEAETCFRKAIAISREQHARSLELRAVMSLARLWQRQGKKTQAHEMLAEIYHWFTEGFDTKDLQEAKALLQELS